MAHGDWWMVMGRGVQGEARGGVESQMGVMEDDGRRTGCVEQTKRIWLVTNHDRLSIVVEHLID